MRRKTDAAVEKKGFEKCFLIYLSQRLIMNDCWPTNSFHKFSLSCLFFCEHDNARNWSIFFVCFSFQRKYKRRVKKRRLRSFFSCWKWQSLRISCRVLKFFSVYLIMSLSNLSFALHNKFAKYLMDVW